MESQSPVYISDYIKKKYRMNISAMDYSEELQKFIVYENLANLLIFLKQDYSCERNEIFTPKLANLINALFVDSGRSFLIHNKVGILELWNTKSQKRVKTIANDVMCFTVDDITRHIYYLASDGSFVIYDFDALEIVQSFSFINETIPNDKWPLLYMQINNDSKKLYVAYKSRLFSVDLSPHVSLPEKQYIESFFPKEKNMMNDEQFALLLSEFAFVYLGSPLLRTYLNPYFMAGCYHLSKCVAIMPKELITAQIIPKNRRGQISSLELAIITKNLNLLSIVCERYMKYENDLILSQAELRILLKLDITIAKQLIASRFQKIDRRRLVSMISGQSDFKQMLVNQIYSEFSEYTLNAVFENRNSPPKRKKKVPVAEKTGIGKFKDTIAKLVNSSQEVADLSKTKKMINNIDSLDFYIIQIKCNFKIGSDDSLEFLRSYSECPFDDFVVSNWRCLIEIKWRQLRYYYWVYSCILIVGTVFLTLSNCLDLVLPDVLF